MKKTFIEINKNVCVCALLIIIFGLSISGRAQYFESPVLNPFGLSSGYGYHVPELVDIDSDGDLDLFLDGGGSQVQYYENIGSDTVPIFDGNLVNPFGYIPSVGVWYVYVSFGDLDADGDLDLMASTDDDGSFGYLENIGSASSPLFDTVEVAPFGLSSITPGEYPNPSLVDIDFDGDLDLFVSYNDTIEFRENIGTATVPDFDQPQINPFGITFQQQGVIQDFSFGDIDQDGDLDMISSGQGITYYFENTGTLNAPQFGMPLENPFGLINISQGPFVCLGDIDTDGDLDILFTNYFVGNDVMQFGYFENVGTNLSIKESLQSLDLITYPNPASNSVVVEWEQHKNGLVSIYDSFGKKVLDEQVLISGSTLSLSCLTAGSYIIKVVAGENVYTSNLVK